MARVARRRRRPAVNIFKVNPRRRRRAPRARAKRSIYMVNPRRRRRARSSAPAARRIYRRNPTRRASARRRTYRRNPSLRSGATSLSKMLMPAVFIGLGAVGTEIVTGYLPIPLAWKTGPMRYVVKGAVGVGLGLVIAKLFKQKRIGYYFAAGAVAIATHDFVKTWLASSAPAIRGLGYVNPGSVARFGQYSKALPMNRFGQYSRPGLRSQFGGANTLPNARQPGGEMNFAA